MSVAEQATAGLRLTGIDMRFGSFRALEGVSLAAPGGSVTALLGENGSGKSTLVKVLAGINNPVSGALDLFDRHFPLPFTPRAAHDAGIRILHQDLGLVRGWSVAENIALSAGFGAGVFGVVFSRRLRLVANHALAAIGVDIDPDKLVDDLSLRDRTFVALARLLASKRDGGDADRALILDEPTAALGPRDAKAVHEVIRNAAASGAAVVVVSHHLGEIIEFADQIAVLRHGKLVTQTSAAGHSPQSLADLMLGSKKATAFKPRRLEKRDTAYREGVLILKGVSGGNLGLTDLTVHAGEVLGIGGERSSGPGDMAAMLSGRLPVKTGHLELRGQRVSPSELQGRDLAFVSEDRRRLGIFPMFSVASNIALNSLRTGNPPLFSMTSPGRETRTARSWIDRMDIRPADPNAIAGRMSGGNQQKLALARALELGTGILVLDEPTQGVDVGAQAIIRKEIEAFACSGGAVVLISTNHDELLALSDRIEVFEHGQIVRSLTGEQLNHSALLNAEGASRRGASTLKQA